MAKKSKLLAALDAHKGRDYMLEKQRKLQKQAARKRKSHLQVPNPDGEDGPIGGAAANGANTEFETNGQGWESDKSQDTVAGAVCWRISLGNFTPCG